MGAAVGAGDRQTPGAAESLVRPGHRLGPAAGGFGGGQTLADAFEQVLHLAGWQLQAGGDLVNGLAVVHVKGDDPSLRGGL